jgi:hypothetical protein
VRSQKTYFSLTLLVSILLGILLPLILGTKEFGTIALIFSSIWWIYKKYLLNLFGLYSPPARGEFVIPAQAGIQKTILDSVSSTE